MLLLLQHLSNIAVGVGAGIANILFIYLLGIVAVPRGYAHKIKGVSQAAVVGATVATLWSWYSIKLNYPLLPALQLLFWVTIGLMGFRLAKHGVSYFFDRNSIRHALRLVALYSFFYTIIYSFLPPGAWGDYLPLSRIGNNDIFNYINYASFYQRLDASNVVGYSFIDEPDQPIYGFCPTTTYVLIGLAKFFNDETLWAAMPTLFGLVGLIGCLVVKLARDSFGVSAPVAIGIASILVGGPFFRYIVGNYFLSQILAMLIVLLLLAKTNECLASREGMLTRAVSLAPYYVLLFFTYPPVFIIGVAFQLAYIFLFNLLSADLERWRFAALALSKNLWSWLMVASACMTVVFLVEPGRAVEIFNFMFKLAKPGVAGWPLQFISPFAALGFPGPLDIHGHTIQIFVAVVFILGLLMMGVHGWQRVFVNNLGRSMFILATLSFSTYFLYWFYSGPTYQQWKVASYLLLPVAFAILAPLCVLIAGASHKYVSWKFESASKLALIFFCVLTVVGNQLLSWFRSPPYRLPVSFSNLRMLEAMDGWQEAYIQMNGFSTTFMPVYFVRNKMLHLISPSYYARQELKEEEISARKPLFIEGVVCGFDGTHIPVAGVGCLFLEPPRFQLRSEQLFSHNIVGLDAVTGLSEPEQWGRWSDGNTVNMRLVISEKDWREGESGFINLQVRPFLFEKVEAQKISISWGKSRFAQSAVRDTGWVSLPYSRADWEGDGARELYIKFDLPGATSPRDVNPKSGDSRRLGIGFLAISLTEQPAGSILGSN